MRILKLTSPLMRGDDVRQMQTELKKDHYLQGQIDGVFGPDTSRAVYKAKYWLGYKKPDHSASTLLYGYLTGKRKPTEAMQATRKRRQQAQAAKPRRLKMIAEARKYIGIKETPFGSNKVMFSKWYGMVGPWCAMFVSYCGVAVGAPQFVRAKRYAYVPYIVNDARAGNNGIAVTYKPLEGDLVCYDWDNDGIADHVGFFVRWLDAGHTMFMALEGNTGHGNNSNGGEVMEPRRSKSDVIAFVHVGG